MVSSNDFKNGLTILYEGNLLKIIEFMHVKPGKGAAFVRTKLRNVRTGAIVDITFNSAEKVTLAEIVKVKNQYLYDTGDALCFMDVETYEQTEIPYNLVSEEMKYLRENQIVEIQKYGDEIIGIILPDKVTLTIVDCEPGVKGDTKSGGAMKDAKLETGLVVKVPLFIENGEEIIVSTIDGKYSSRA